MNRKITKSALFSSALALLLCVSMLIGTTFAWFTDSVASGNNKIVAGNLDVELEYLAADGTWKPVDENTNVFMENTLWEPGHTEVVYLRVVNAGSLAFDYKLGVNIKTEKGSTNVDGDKFKLSDYIVMGALEDVNTAYADRAAARDALAGKPVMPIADEYAFKGTLWPVGNVDGKATDKYLSLVVYMPETVGNEANYDKAFEAPEVVLGISVLATQETYEKDSFDEKYDANASAGILDVPVENRNITLNVYDLDNFSNYDVVTTDIDVYTFDAATFANEYPVATYKDWTCDYFVSTDSAMKEGTFLAGQYDAWSPDWLGFWVPASDEPYEEIGLLGLKATGGESNWTYEEICDGVNVFECGVVDFGDPADAPNNDGINDGVKVTVELRMTSPDKSQTITVAEIEVVLG